MHSQRNAASWRRSLLIALMMSTALAGTAYGAQLHGHVVDAGTGSSMPGATIRVQGTNITANADKDGFFLIPNLQAGNYTLLVDYVGYPRIQQDVTVQDGASPVTDIKLMNGGTVAEQVTITGQFLAERRALQAKKNADNLTEQLYANDVGKLPDQNVAEAVRRLPGISVANDMGEGRYVLIRGVNYNLANVTVNGQTAPAPEPDGRQVKLDDIPSSLIESLEVTKSLTPDRDANAIAGQVDIGTLSAFDRQGTFLYGRVAAGYYHLNGKHPYDGDLTAGGTFGSDNQYGLVLSGNYSHRPINSENFGSGGPTWAPVGGVVLPSNQQIRDYNLTRTRSGLVGNFDWHGAGGDQFFIRAMYSTFGDDEIRDRFTVNIPTSAGSFSTLGAVTGAFTTGGRAMRYVRAREENDHTLNLSTGGKIQAGGGVLDVEAAWAEAVKVDPRRNEWQFRTGSTVAGSYDLSEFLYLVVPNATAYDPTKFAFNQLVHANRTAVEELYQTRADYTLPIESFGDTNDYLKIGMKLLYRHKANDQTSATFVASGTTMTLNDAFHTGDAATYDGRYTFGPRVDYATAEAFFAAAHGTQACDASTAGGFRCDINASAAASATVDYTVAEKVLAGYAMVNLKFGQLTLIPGLRIEGTDGRYRSFTAQLSGGTPVITPISSSRTYTNWFPGVNARFDVDENLVLRAAVTTSIGRPDYATLPPFVTVDTTASPVAVSKGNPDLKPLKALNVDGTIEYYLPNQGVIAVGAFYKNIDDPIYTETISVTNGTFGGIAVAGAASVTTPRNADQGIVKGVELNVQSGLGFISPMLDGFGVAGNIAFIDSSATGLANRADTIPLFNQSDKVGTAQLFYEKYGFAARLVYSYRSRYLDTVGGSTAMDQYTAALGQLDARGSFEVTDNFTVFVEGTNLTDAPWRRYIGQSDHVYENEHYGWSMRTGVQFKF